MKSGSPPASNDSHGGSMCRMAASERVFHNCTLRRWSAASGAGGKFEKPMRYVRLFARGPLESDPHAVDARSASRMARSAAVRARSAIIGIDHSSRGNRDRARMGAHATVGAPLYLALQTPFQQ